VPATPQGPDGSLPPNSWPVAHAAARRLVSPIQQFLRIEAASGLLLLAAAVIALVWANSPLRGAYDDLWHTPVGFTLGEWNATRPLHFWVNDGLMTIFFFVVGLEVRREIHEGELSDLRRAALPVAAAIGGMAIPAVIYAAFNAGRAGGAGWGIPMATDIAFAVGVLTLLGNRIAPALRVLLLALAVIDDVGAILVIAIFYSTGISFAWLGFGALATGVVMGLRALGIRSPAIYLAPGIVLWACVYRAGIHPTLAGVVLGLLTPVRSWFGAEDAASQLRGHADALPRANEHELVEHMDSIRQVNRETVSPAASLQHLLHPWVAFLIMPLFALANSGVQLGGASFSGDGWRVFAGIVAGLVIGKPIGVFIASRTAIGARLSVRPRDVDDRGLAVVGVVAGIGFTMSLFIAQLAFPPGPLLETAKLAILVASGCAILIGLIGGRLTLPKLGSGVASASEAEREAEV
jgi:NhaA family Na+:H+ antiporter